MFVPEITSARKFRLREPVMNREISSEAEEYLEAIYRLQRWRGIAKTTELASQLNVVPGSVTNTVRHLKKHGLVEHKPYKGVRLTEEGKKITLGILRRHRLAERLLTDILGVDWSIAHENACKLEHALTEEVIRLLEKKLGSPKSCPHGNPIPSGDGRIDEEKCNPLTKGDIDKPYTVLRIINEKRKKLLVLASKGIIPGVSLHVVKRVPEGLVLRVDGKECTLGHDVASDVGVKSMEEKNYALEKEAVVGKA